MSTIKPEALAKANTEEAHQMAFFCYLAAVINMGFSKADLWADLPASLHTEADYPPNYRSALKWLHHCPNGESRGDSAKTRAIRGAKLKAMGTKSGVLDCFLPYSVGGKHGLYIEFKKPESKGTSYLSDDQLSFALDVQIFGYCVQYANTWQEAVTKLKAYLRGTL